MPAPCSEVLTEAAMLLLVQVGFEEDVQLAFSCPVPFDDLFSTWCPGYLASFLWRRLMEWWIEVW